MMALENYNKLCPGYLLAENVLTYDIYLFIFKMMT